MNIKKRSVSNANDGTRERREQRNIFALDIAKNNASQHYQSS